jgi:hypothetical protein
MRDSISAAARPIPHEYWRSGNSYDQVPSLDLSSTIQFFSPKCVQEDEDLRLAMELSLQEHQKSQPAFAGSYVSSSCCALVPLSLAFLI